MKKVLVIGAAGNIGLETIKYLLSEGKYEITALDLRNHRTFKKLKKYRKRINIVYGDVNDRLLIDNLISDHNIVMFLSGVIPPLSEIKKDIEKDIEYNGLKNVIRAINAYNPKCHLFFTSSTTIYGCSKEQINEKSDIVINEFDNYGNIKLMCEKIIAKHLSNYTIYRLPLVVGDFVNDYPIYNIKALGEIELITNRDCAYGLVSSIVNINKLNKKTYNMTGGINFRTTVNDYLIDILSIYGLSFRYLFTRLFIPKNIYLHTYNNTEVLDSLLHFRTETYVSYKIRLKRSKMYNKRFLARLIAKPLIFMKKKRG